MKTAFKVFGCILSLFIVFLIYKGRDIQEIKTEIDISAPPEKVWEALINIETWPEWSPIIKGAEGSAQSGSQLTITMAGKDGADGPKYQPIITVFDAPKIFRWRAHMISGFLFTNDKIFELQALSDGGTKLIHKELFKGLLAPIFCGKMEEGVPPMLDSMNQAFKNFVESQ